MLNPACPIRELTAVWPCVSYYHSMGKEKSGKTARGARKPTRRARSAGGARRAKTTEIARGALRAIPSVDDVLGQPALEALRRKHPVFPWTRLVREVMDTYRGLRQPPDEVDGADRASVRTWIVSEVELRVEELLRGGQRRVINGTGVLLHTNLGRAVLDQSARAAVDEALGHYVSLEVDLDTGRRSKRATVLNRLLALATGAEDAMIVNNNAAAVYLVANSYSPPGRVVVSRGELVEIGGSFRLPEILRHAAAEVVEVGTTNRTYAGDYRKVARKGDILLKVHKSNYSMKGFVHEATYAELAEVAKEKACHAVYDLGSGAVFDYRSAGVGRDDRIEDVLSAGVACVTMSGDKLLGGMQAGLIVGRERFLERLRQNPLRRALRVDKVTIAGLQEVLRRYLFEPDTIAAIPLLGQVLGEEDAVRTRAESVTGGLSPQVRSAYEIDVVDDEAAVGGGSWSSAVVLSSAIRIRCASDSDAVSLARTMRRHVPPVISRLKDREIRINMRSVMPYEDDELRAALERILCGAIRRDSRQP